MCSPMLLQAFLLLQFTDTLLVESHLRYTPGDLHTVGVPAWPHPSPSKGPHISPDTPRSVRTALGTPAHLPCKARNLGGRSVSWIRHRDLHVLTVGAFVFTSDGRFSAHRDAANGDWVLVLRRPKPEDAGLYECSVSSKPVVTWSVRLEVVVPKVEMVGGKSVYLDHGSTLTLTCLIHHTPVPPEFILWYHRDKLVNYGVRSGREIRVFMKHQGETTTSTLTVHRASFRDSGRYSCQPSNADRASVSVHVLRSETPAAMQTTTSSTPSSRRISPFLVLVSLVLALLPPVLALSPQCFVLISSFLAIFSQFYAHISPILAFFSSYIVLFPSFFVAHIAPFLAFFSFLAYIPQYLTHLSPYLVPFSSHLSHISSDLAQIPRYLAPSSSLTYVRRLINR